MRYNKGDILICSTKEMWGKINHELVVGDKYRVLDVIYMPEYIILDIIHESSNKRIGMVLDRHFITLQSYREWKLKQIIND